MTNEDSPTKVDCEETEQLLDSHVGEPSSPQTPLAEPYQPTVERSNMILRIRRRLFTSITLFLLAFVVWTFVRKEQARIILGDRIYSSIKRPPVSDNSTSSSSTGNKSTFTNTTYSNSAGNNGKSNSASSYSAANNATGNSTINFTKTTFNNSFNNSTVTNVTLADAMRPLSPLAQEQIANYKRGTGLMLNVHITHHGGTAFCAGIGHAPDANGDYPSFACMKPRDNGVSNDYPKKRPWRANETATNIAVVRQYFHMISWEFVYAPDPPIRATDWENPHLLSILILRDPMKRMLAGDGIVRRDFPGLLQGRGTRQQWLDFAQTSNRHTNNAALRVLAGDGCCAGNETSVEFLRAAQDLVQRFSIVIDIECLTESMEALAQLLDITPGHTNKVRVHKSPRERIGHDDIYEYLLDKNKMDIALYKWSKGISLLDCSKL